MDTQTALVAVYTPSDDDIRMIGNWLKKQRSEHTQRSYRRIALGLLTYTQKALPDMTLDDLQKYQESLTGKNSSVALATNILKSLFTFTSSDGINYTHNIGKMLTPPIVEDELAQRIVSETDMIRMVALETDARNHAMLRLMYHAGLRVSELVALKWEKVDETANGAVLHILGKGGKTRHVPIGQDVYRELLSLNGRFLGKDRYVFQSRKGKAGTVPMETRQVGKIVEQAAIRADVAIYYDETGKKRSHFSPHWERHAHVSHSLDNGEDITVVSRSVGHSRLDITMSYRHIKPEEGSSRKIKI